MWSLWFIMDQTVLMLHVHVAECTGILFCRVGSGSKWLPVLMVWEHQESEINAYRQKAFFIREYGSNFYAGISQVKNDRLYLRYASSSEKSHSQVSQNSYRQKGLPILLLKMPQEFCYPTQKLRKENVKISILLFFFVLTSSSCITEKQ